MTDDIRTIRPLFHYTCECGHAALTEDPVIRPAAHLVPAWKLLRTAGDIRSLLALSWFTDLAIPDVDALGLTRRRITCARWRYRWIVTGVVQRPVPWLTERHRLPARVVHELERSPGAQPEHWWVSRVPVTVQYHPLQATERKTARR